MKADKLYFAIVAFFRNGEWLQKIYPRIISRNILLIEYLVVMIVLKGMIIAMFMIVFYADICVYLLQTYVGAILEWNRADAYSMQLNGFRLCNNCMLCHFQDISDNFFHK